ncbi:hypothetical protein BC829DRAFT_291478 [Chytridium lagenaria]|nr:hypothetical protein BC829DRAFT_291478 [Chytridium lagenaria]
MPLRNAKKEMKEFGVQGLYPQQTQKVRAVSVQTLPVPVKAPPIASGMSRMEEMDVRMRLKALQNEVRGVKNMMVNRIGVSVEDRFAMGEPERNKFYETAQRYSPEPYSESPSRPIKGSVGTKRPVRKECQCQGWEGMGDRWRRRLGQMRVRLFPDSSEMTLGNKWRLMKEPKRILW